MTKNPFGLSNYVLKRIKFRFLILSKKFPSLNENFNDTTLFLLPILIISSDNSQFSIQDFNEAVFLSSLRICLQGRSMLNQLQLNI